MLCWSVIVGVLGALATVVFRHGIAGLVALIVPGGRLASDGTDALVEISRHLSVVMRVTLPVVGGLVAGGFLLLAERGNRHGSSSDYMESIALGDGKVPVRQSLLRSLSALFTISTGGSIGREGPMIQLAATVSSSLGQAIGLDVKQLKLLVACGAAAGITAAYNTPIAGAFFINEIVVGSFAFETFGPILLAAVASNITMRALPEYHPVYLMPAFPQLSAIDYGLSAVLGVIAGVLAPKFLLGIKVVRQWFKKIPVAIPLRLAFGGLIVGLISDVSPEVWGNGYGVVNSLLHSNWTMAAVVVVLVAKVCATLVSVGSGSIGGTFTPTIFIGAAIGWLFGACIHHVMPSHPAGNIAFAMVGMGALLAAATDAPVMAVLMIFEMTLSYQAVLPLIIACVVGCVAARYFGTQTMYSIASSRKTRALAHAALRATYMRDIITPTDTIVDPSAGLATMSRLFALHSVKYLYVVDSQRGYKGTVALRDLNKRLVNGFESASSLKAVDFVRSNAVEVLTPEMQLSDAVERFLRHTGERLPAVQSAENPIFLGTVAKSTLLQTFCHLDEGR